MGEAKRRNKLGLQVEQAMRQRIDAGEFGAAGTVSEFCVVLDKSSIGRDALARLRAMAGLGELETLANGLDLQLWEASGLFQYAVLAGSAGAKGRTLLAADLSKLLAETLPKALSRRAGASAAGVLIAVEPEALAAIQARAKELKGG